MTFCGRRANGLLTEEAIISEHVMMPSDKSTICPKCNYVRTDGDALFHKGICPSCGIVYARVEGASAEQGKSREDFKEYSPDEMRAKRKRSNNRVQELLFYVPDNKPAEVFWGYCALYLVFFAWGWHFITAGIKVEPIMGSFMHNINLPFHEFGHVLFSPFGRFMAILGGSLFQLLVPIIVALIFLIKQRDAFAASIATWWLGQSFIDLSPYIADASYRSLPLVAGMGEEAHDWGNLLTMMDLLQYDYSIARGSFFIGSVIIVCSMAWGAYILLKLYRVRE